MLPWWQKRIAMALPPVITPIGDTSPPLCLAGEDGERELLVAATSLVVDRLRRKRLMVTPPGVSAGLLEDDKGQKGQKIRATVEHWNDLIRYGTRRRSKRLMLQRKSAEEFLLRGI